MIFAIRIALEAMRQRRKINRMLKGCPIMERRWGYHL